MNGTMKDDRIDESYNFYCSCRNVVFLVIDSRNSAKHFDYLELVFFEWENHKATHRHTHGNTNTMPYAEMRVENVPLEFRNTKTH